MSLTSKKHDSNMCGVAIALEVIGGKWTILIIRDLLGGTKRFSELESSLAGISPRTLALRLKELERDHILVRDCSAGEAHPRYHLTKRGLDLQKLIDQVREWGDGLKDDRIAERGPTPPVCD